MLRMILINPIIAQQVINNDSARGFLQIEYVVEYTALRLNYTLIKTQLNI